MVFDFFYYATLIVFFLQMVTVMAIQTHFLKS